MVNADANDTIQLVIFEGWSVGFRAVQDDTVLRRRWEDAVREATAEDGSSSYTGRLGYARFEDIKVVNDALKEYDVLTE